MRAHVLIGVLGLSFLAGCPSPPDDGPPGGEAPPAPGAPGPAADGQPGGQGDGPPPGDGAAPPPGDAPADGAAPPAEGVPPADAADLADPDEHSFEVMAGDRPTFASIIEEGDETVTITVTVVGEGKGQVDFTVFEDEAPKVLHIEPFEDTSAPLTVTAPATFDGSIGVVAMSHADTPMGSEPAEIVLDGSDKALTLTMKPVDPDAPPPLPPTGAPPAPAGNGG